ncbi:MAG: response regulator transcription factor [Desulfobulbaceae bacterium]|nr:response regulator transcription factor [Desulfobulbaceae bacterium]
MSRPNILIVEDDSDIQQLVTYNLIKAGMHAICADNGADALNVLEREQVDAVILDLMLPGEDGLEICRAIRENERTRRIPVIMLTARSEEDDIVAGLEIGADDYVTKPFSPKVLVARLQAVLRRNLDEQQEGEFATDTIVIHPITIHPGRHEVFLEGVPIQLTGTEFAILHVLARKAGWVFTRQQIIDHIRGYEYLITPRAVDVQIFGLRKKLGSAGHLVQTVRGIGYRMKE